METSSWGSHMPQSAFGQLVDADERTVKRWEAGGKFSVDSAVLIVRYARCDLGWLILGPGHGRPPRGGASGARMTQDERSTKEGH